MSSGKSVKEDDLISLCQLPDATSDTRRFYTTLRSHLLKMQYDPVLSLLTLKVKNGEKKCLDDLFADCRDVNTAEVPIVIVYYCTGCLHYEFKIVPLFDCFFHFRPQPVSYML